MNSSDIANAVVAVAALCAMCFIAWLSTRNPNK